MLNKKIILILCSLILLVQLDAKRQQIVIRNETLENLYATIDWTEIKPYDKFEIAAGTSKNYFVDGIMQNNRTLFLVCETSSGTKKYQVVYNSNDYKLYLKQDTIVLDEISFAPNNSIPITIVYNYKYEAEFSKVKPGVPEAREPVPSNAQLPPAAPVA